MAGVVLDIVNRRERLADAEGMSFNAAVGITVKQYMFLYGIAAPQIAELINVTNMTLHRKTRGITGFYYEELLTISRLLHIDVDVFKPIELEDGSFMPAQLDLSSLRPRQDSNLQPKD